MHSPPRVMRRRTPATTSPEPAPPSKSQLKRDSHALQRLGADLIELSDERLVLLPLNERLIDAVRLARTITAHEGRRRQVQYIGKLMRDIDAGAIRQAMEAEHQQHRVDTAVMHATERWRERLIEAPEGLEQWLAVHPDTRDAVARLLAAARAELSSGVRGRYYRDLFRLIRDTLSARTQEAALHSQEHAPR